MNSDEGFIFFMVLIGIFAIIMFSMVHAFSPKTDFTNQCIRHHGIPNTHINQWACVGADNESK